MIVLTPVDGDPRAQESSLRPLIITTIDKRGKIREILYIEKHEALCDLCGSPIALTRRKLEERARGLCGHSRCQSGSNDMREV